MCRGAVRLNDVEPLTRTVFEHSIGALLPPPPDLHERFDDLAPITCLPNVYAPLIVPRQSRGACGMHSPTATACTNWSKRACLSLSIANEAGNSALLRQYVPSRDSALAHPTVLSETDLTNAFEPDLAD